MKFHFTGINVIWAVQKPESTPYADEPYKPKSMEDWQLETRHFLICFAINKFVTSVLWLFKFSFWESTSAPWQVRTNGIPACFFFYAMQCRERQLKKSKYFKNTPLGVTRNEQ